MIFIFSVWSDLLILMIKNTSLNTNQRNIFYTCGFVYVTYDLSVTITIPDSAIRLNPHIKLSSIAIDASVLNSMYYTTVERIVLNPFTVIRDEGKGYVIRNTDIDMAACERWPRSSRVMTVKFSIRCTLQSIGKIITCLITSLVRR